MDTEKLYDLIISGAENAAIGMVSYPDPGDGYIRDEIYAMVKNGHISIENIVGAFENEIRRTFK